MYSVGDHLAECPSKKFGKRETCQNLQLLKGIWSSGQFIGALIQVTQCHLYKCHCPLAQVQAIGTHPSNIPDWFTTTLAIDYPVYSQSPARLLPDYLTYTAHTVLHYWFSFTDKIIWVDNKHLGSAQPELRKSFWMTWTGIVLICIYLTQC